MSRIAKNNTMKKPYCKVCHDAGKPENEYTSHWVKDLSGKTTCPTLLNLECRYCFKPGHTVKFCDALSKKKENEKKERKNPPVQIRTQKPAPKQVNKASGFAALDYDSDEEVEVVVDSVVVVERVEEPVLSGWAAIAAKPKEVQEVVQNNGMIFLTKSKPVQKPVQKPVEAPVEEPVQKPVVFTKRWADLSDSEDDEDW